jgi:hypothetical protein
MMKQREHAALAYVAALKKSFTTSAADLSLRNKSGGAPNYLSAGARQARVFVFCDCGSGANKREEPGFFPSQINPNNGPGQ